MAVTEEDVRRAYYASAGAPSSWWITEMQMSPTRLIVADESDGAIYQVPFSIDGGSVQFSAAQSVGSYADVAAAGGAAMVYASAEESRSVMDTGDAGGGDGGMWDGEWETELEDPLDAVLAAGAEVSDRPWSGFAPADYSPAQWHAATLIHEHEGGTPDTKDACKLPVREPAGAVNRNGVHAAAAALAGAHGGVHASAEQKDKAKAALRGLYGTLGEDPPGAIAAAMTSSDGDGSEGPSSEAGGMTHPPFTGKHAHPHAAYGDQGADDTHDHMHTHENDSVHDPNGQASPHTHGPKASSKEGESDMEFTADQLAGIRLRLGKRPGDEITGADIAAAITQAPQFAASAGAGVDGGQVPEVGEGAYLVDGSVIKEWQQRALAGDHAVHRLSVAERDSVLASAMEDGRFPQARLDHYKAMWDRDPDGTRKYVETLASGFVVPMGGKGSNGSFDPDMGGDFEGQDAYRTLYPEDVRGGVSAAAGIPGGRR